MASGRCCRLAPITAQTGRTICVATPRVGERRPEENWGGIRPCVPFGRSVKRWWSQGWNERGGTHLRRRWGKRGIDVAQGGCKPQRVEPETTICVAANGRGKRSREENWGGFLPVFPRTRFAGFRLPRQRSPIRVQRVKGHCPLTRNPVRG